MPNMYKPPTHLVYQNGQPVEVIPGVSPTRSTFQLPTDPRVTAFIFQGSDGKQEFWRKNKDGTWHREEYDPK